MDRSAKFLLIAVVFLIISGFGLIYFGMQSQNSEIVHPSPTPLSKNISKESTSSASLGIEGEKAIVVKVVDGDTFELEDGQKVRMVGIDTPETVDPRRPVGCFGKEASNKSKELLTGKEVILQKDISDRDKYKRLLRYVYLPLDDGRILFVNDYLVRGGYAKSYTYPPDVKYSAEFKEAEKQARENNRGLWGKCM